MGRNGDPLFPSEDTAATTQAQVEGLGMVLKVNSGEAPSGMVASAEALIFSGPRALWMERDQPALGQADGSCSRASHPINWKRHEADVFTPPDGHFDRRVLVAAGAATSTAA